MAVIGLNGAGKTTLLKLLDGALAATSGSVSITAGETALSPAVKRDLKRIEDIVGRVRREEIPDSYYRAATIREAIDQPLKKHKVPESERLAIVGNLFAHFGLSTVARQSASSLNSEQRHLLAIASALSFSPAAIVADEPTKGLDEIGSAHVAKALFGYNKQVIFATHDVDMITRPQYAIDRALVVDDHAVVFDGEPAAAAAFYEGLIPLPKWHDSGKHALKTRRYVFRFYAKTAENGQRRKRGICICEFWSVLRQSPQQFGHRVQHDAHVMREFVRFGQQRYGQIAVRGHVEEIAGLAGDAMRVNHVQHQLVLIDDARHAQQHIPAALGPARRRRRAGRTPASVQCPEIALHPAAHEVGLDASPPPTGPGCGRR